ncbi:MAG: hypothetical protein HC824_19215 [Synechococcales cyanobacterium RM1_1_8]|nr:hypothetical protein [Synechococcales cyanobacterium RM1_1_8]
MSNAQRYSLRDIVLSAFAMSYMQCPSFLEHQRQMQSRQGKNNASQLFGLQEIAIDQVSAASLFGVFKWIYQALSGKGWLKSYEVLGGQQLVGLDGVDYFSSNNISLILCSMTQFNYSLIYPNYLNLQLLGHQNDELPGFHCEPCPSLRDRPRIFRRGPELLLPLG